MLPVLLAQAAEVTETVDWSALADAEAAAAVAGNSSWFGGRVDNLLGYRRNHRVSLPNLVDCSSD